MSTRKIHGFAAIAFAERFGIDVKRRASPISGEKGEGWVDAEEAMKIAEVDPHMIELDVPALDSATMTPTHAAIIDPSLVPTLPADNGRAVAGLGVSDEMAFAEALRVVEPEDATTIQLAPIIHGTMRTFNRSSRPEA
jgi:hypothetical protein